MADDGKPINCGQFFIAIEPKIFSGGLFHKQVSALAKAVTAQPGARLPNARRLQNQKRLAKEGLPIERKLYNRLIGFA
jgi:(2R)-3-sulfolactate dehydrogenase (NADP+)